MKRLNRAGAQRSKDLAEQELSDPRLSRAGAQRSKDLAEQELSDPRFLFNQSNVGK